MNSNLQKIGFVADLIGISAQTIRTWEKDNLIARGRRVDGRGTRAYTLTQVADILEHARSLGYPITLALIDHYRGQN